MVPSSIFPTCFDLTAASAHFVLSAQALKQCSYLHLSLPWKVLPKEKRDMQRLSCCDSLPVKQCLPENNMLAIFSNPTDHWYFLFTLYIWENFVSSHLCYWFSWPMHQYLYWWSCVGQGPVQMGYNCINLCLFRTSVYGANPETAFSSEQLVFLRQQHQFSTIVPRGKAVAQVAHLPVIANSCLGIFLHFLPS